MFYEEGDAFITFVRPQGYAYCVLVTACKHNFSLFTRKLHIAPLSNNSRVQHVNQQRLKM